MIASARSQRLRALSVLGVLSAGARSALSHLDIIQEPESQRPRAGSGLATDSIRMVPEQNAPWQDRPRTANNKANQPHAPQRGRRRV